jgi:hypothetical protein
MATTERLRQALADLEAQLRDAETLDAETQAQLRRAAADINAKLARQSSSAEGQGSESAGETSVSEIEGSLRERLVDFEASHPQLAMVLTRVIDLLGQAGI